MLQEVEASCSSSQSDLTNKRKYKEIIPYTRRKGNTESKLFVCNECEFVARVEAVFISHVNLHRPKFGEEGCLSSCPHCHYNIQTKQQLDFHIKTCHKYKLLKQQTEAAREEESEHTDYSDVEFISDGDLDMESARLSNKWPVHKKCGKELENDSKVGLENQEMVCDPGRPDSENTFAASTSNFNCSKPKLWWEQLFGGEIKRHETIQSAEEKFLCKYCGKRVSHIKRHEKTHLKVKEFSCYLCKKEFTRKYNLTAHIANMHAGNNESFKSALLW